MAKVKRQSDEIHRKKAREERRKKQLNPFEVHVIKQKINVLGRSHKCDRGLPGIARSKAIKKRKSTLLVEYKYQNKNNLFKDKRIGERNEQLSNEDKMLARFAAVKRKQNRKAIYNLGEADELTHKGQSLAEIEAFEDAPNSDTDEDDKGNLGSDWVDSAHFGGGVLQKKQGTDQSHKQVIEQLIADTKRRRAERQKEKDDTVGLTEKLNETWKDLIPIVANTMVDISHLTNGTINKTIDADYDKLVRELRFERRGGVSEPLLNEQEMAKQEKAKREKLERERLERMRDDEDANENIQRMINQHRSADDLDDGFIFDTDQGEEPQALSYINGVMSIPIDNESKKLSDNDLNQSNTNAVNIESNDNQCSDENEDEDDDDEEDTSEEEHFSDLKLSSSESETEDVSTITQNNDQLDTKQHEVEAKEKVEPKSTLRLEEVVPDTYDDFLNIMKAHSSNKYWCETIKTMTQWCCSNKNKSSILFDYALKFGAVHWPLLSGALVSMFELAQYDKQAVCSILRQSLCEHFRQFCDRKKVYPNVETLWLLRVIGVVCSTSDFKHGIVTPAFIYIEQMLSNCKIRNSRDLAYGLFLTTLAYDYTHLSKRYIPAVINFLTGVIHAAIPKTVRRRKVISPFNFNDSYMVLLKPCENYLDDGSDGHFLKLDALSGGSFDGDFDEEFKLRAMHMTLKLLQDFHCMLQRLSSCKEIFSFIESYLNDVPFDIYPTSIRNEFTKCMEMINKYNERKQLVPLRQETLRPKALRLYEPKIEPVHDGKARRSGLSREKKERDKLIHKVKKERKGAIREIRRDKMFLARVRIQSEIKSDVERKEKVKRLYSEAAIQQSELKQFDKKAKKSV